MNTPPYAAQPPAPPRKGLSGGCIAAIVIALVAALLAGSIFVTMAIYGVRRYLANAKAAEAKNNVSAIARAAVVAAEDRKALCGSASPVPVDLRSVRGIKYAPTSSDFQTGSPSAGWSCLKFSVAMPMYYQLQYHAGSGYVTAAGVNAGATGFEAAALGDLNGDGVPSHFARTGKVEGGHLVLSTEIYIDNEFE